MIPKLLPASPDTHADAKAQARRLAKALAGRLDLKHGQALELIAKVHGQASWGHLSAALDARLPATMTFPATADDGMGGVLVGGETLNHIFARVRAGLPGSEDAAGEVLHAVFRGTDPMSIVPDMNAAALRARMQLAFYGSRTAPETADALIRDILSALIRIPCREHPREMEMTHQLIRLLIPSTAVFCSLEDAGNLFDGRHSLLFGTRTDLVRAETLRRGTGFWDLSGAEFDLTPIAAALSVKMPEGGFRDPVDGLKWIAGHAYETAPVRQVVILPVGRHATGVDVLMAQGRSLGLHICLRPDSQMVTRCSEYISLVSGGSFILSDDGLVFKNH